MRRRPASTRSAPTTSPRSSSGWPARRRAAAPGRGARRIGDFDPAMLVHAEQAFELRRPLATDGRLVATATVTGIYDKGSGALVVTESVAADPATGETVIVSRGSAFIRGEGG